MAPTFIIYYIIKFIYHIINNFSTYAIKILKILIIFKFLIFYNM